MKWRQESTTLLACALLSLPHHPQVGQSVFGKCRIVTSSDLRDADAPKFKAYQVPVPQLAEIATLDLKSSATARMFRTVLQQEINKGANFAGYYRVAIWGCGTSCANFAVINLKTGRVIQPETFYSASSTYFGTDVNAVFPDSQSDDDTFGFRKDSNLLVVLGDRNDDESREGAFYFVLEAERLRLIHSTLVKKDCESLRNKR